MPKQVYLKVLLAMLVQDNPSATNMLGKLFRKPIVYCNIVGVQQVLHGVHTAKKEHVCWLHGIYKVVVCSRLRKQLLST